MKNYILLAILHYLFIVTVYCQDTIITTKLVVYTGKVIKVDSVDLILNRNIGGNFIKQVFDLNEILQIISKMEK